MAEAKELDLLHEAHTKFEATGIKTGYQAAIDFTAGAIGGTACTITGQPFDTIKVKLQTYPQLYTGTIQCTKSILKSEGASGLFQGTVPALAAIVGETAVLFLAYGFCQKVVARISGKSNTNNLTSFERALSGSGAAVFSSLVLCPTELIKCRLQAFTEVMATNSAIQKRIGPWQVTKDLIKKDGALGLFQGLTSTWLREVPGYFFFFFGYEITKTLLTPAGKTKDELGKNTLGRMGEGGGKGGLLR
ncbi:putative mitochondrial ornithine transporter 1-like isoform X2 [Apostichopus japonicus]|uniref:Putative mitochondrial ornithine transporter 1-like isoform X2 n=1 Tax=Stichopus japonicus TaxID=307972 RepID=A0A2G8LJV8_STIJA|nr:putative mitochondrial ornithine transporter 1-like isoform X2 [Apostichopus japonicus]